ncbi:MAG TPA: SagB family peptide dehydrogenase [Acidimicrobiia bacterium]
MNTGSAARRLHESTKHGTPPAEPEELVSYRRLDPTNLPQPFKEYEEDLPEIELPRKVVGSSLPAGEVLSGRRGERIDLDLSLLSTLLFLSAGVTRVMDVPDRRLHFRPAMSAGNLHPVELYVVAGDHTVDGLEAGVYHFSPLRFGLTMLRRGDYRDVVSTSAHLVLVLTGIPWRTTWKYAERGWRHLYWDAGTLLANTLSVAGAHGLDHQVVLGFDDSLVSEMVGIDGVEEMPLALVALGEIEPPGQTPSLDSISPEVAPIATRPVRLPLLEQAQRGSELDRDEVEPWREAGKRAAASAPTDVEPPEDTEDPIEAVILRRGSTRRMVRETVSKEALEWPMKASCRPVDIDATGDGTLLSHYVNVHAVSDMEPAAYRHTSFGWEMVRRAETFRELSARLCLGQALGGDSAYTVFHCAELDPIFDALGSRGYRLAQLEAGVVSGRLALCAFALGLGATGLTFIDDAVSSFFHTSAQPMLVTSVGVPASGVAPSGAPGEPVVLRG